MRMPRSIAGLASLSLVVAACSSEQQEPADQGATSAIEPPQSAAEAPDIETPGHRVLTPAGLGDLRVGAPIPAGSSWAARGDQMPDTTCRIISSPTYPEVYGIMEDGIVKRITLTQGSSIRLADGVGVGTYEDEVLAEYPGLREEPHAYAVLPGKYLTAPNADSREPALRFEIGEDGKVSHLHVGIMPVLSYVEGCA